MNKAHRLAMVELNCAALLLGGTSLFPRFVPLPSDQLVWARSLVALVAIILWMRIRGEKIKFERVMFMPMMVVGALMCLHWVTYLYALQTSTVALGVISLFTFPVFTVLLEPFFYGRRPLLADALMAGFVLLGVYLIVPEVSWQNSMFVGVCSGVLSAVAYALRNICIRRYANQVSPMMSMGFQLVFILIVLAPFSSVDVTAIDASLAATLLVFGIIFTALPHVLMVSSMRALSAKTVGLMGSMQPVYSVSFAAILLQESVSFMTVLGGLIVVSVAIYETVHVRPIENERK